jgi:AICAR transformylase/IMP cyclohydrolase PurH
LYLGTDLYRALVERLLPVAGTGNADQIRAVFGPLAKERIEPMADRLAHPAPCPACGAVTGNEIKIALGEIGNIWPRSIYGDVIAANQEEHSNS